MQKNSAEPLQITTLGFALASGISVGLGLAGKAIFWVGAILFGLAFIFSQMELKKNG